MKLAFTKSWTNTLILLALAISTIGVTPAYAATITVTNLNDNGKGSLRQAVTDAVPGDTITFSLSGCPCVITLTTGEISISKNLTITGTGPSNLTISGNNASRVFSIAGATTLNLSQLKITGGSAGSDYGGAIYIDTNGTANISNSAISGNSANLGGAIWNNDGAKLILSNSTVNNNSATGNGGGGIYANGSGTDTTITNSTITGNSATGSDGGGITNGGTMNITNSTIANNTAGGGIFNGSTSTTTLRNTIVSNNTGGNCTGAGTVTNGGNNIDSGTSCGWGSASGSMSSTDPLLVGLTNNGGVTETMALSVNSPAIDKGDNTVCASGMGTPNYGAGGIDQRGVIRPIDGDAVVGAVCDIGAYEFDPLPYKLFLPLIMR